jgi:UDP-N-acetylglucosamine--N-acetylmuramyl-(pentapeptide) pyrophosphoryl-undecaprenol N-acetylglucosamine transferase
MRLLIGGGGTGGHLFSGVAMAEELRIRDPEAAVLFVGTARGIEARVLPGLGWDLELIQISGLKTVGALGAVRGLLRVPRALVQARRIVQKFRPDVVIGVGGYASGPVVLVARLMGIRTAILEQNSLPGLANKILGRVVARVFLCFEESRRFFAPAKIAMSGNPIRREILLSLSAAASGAGRAEVGAAAAPFSIFVTGGSQGARAVNQLVADAAGILARRGIPLSIVHQTGTAELEPTRQRYATHGVTADLRAFIDDMAGEYARADLVIARSGATTVAELGVVGKPAILIPYPHAADNHQEVNAREMADAGAALMLRQAELSGERLANTIADLVREPEALARMASAMRALGKPRAAATIVDWCDGAAVDPA